MSTYNSNTFFKTNVGSFFYTTNIKELPISAINQSIITFNNLSGYMFDHGYTGHEHLEEFGLINMNGRLYDPLLGRMLNPDNYVQAPDFSQSFNRYSYCVNNPLRYLDPSGYEYIPEIPQITIPQYTMPVIEIPQVYIPNYNIANSYSYTFSYSQQGFGSYNSYNISVNYSYSTGYIWGMNYIEYDLGTQIYCQGSSYLYSYSFINGNISTPNNNYSVNLEQSINYTFQYGYYKPNVQNIINNYKNNSFTSPSISLKFPIEIAHSSIFSIDGYYTKTKTNGNPNVENFINGYTGKPEGTSAKTRLGYFYVGVDGSATWGYKYISYGANIEGNYILDISIPTGKNETMGTIFYFNPDQFINNSEYLLKILEKSLINYYPILNPLNPIPELILIY